MKRAKLLVCLLALGAVVTYEARAQVIETTKGKVEFIGLKTWTPQMIYTKLGYASLDKMHNCAALLKDKLGFADASVGFYLTEPTDEENKRNLYTVITVVEPNDAGLVKYKAKPTKSIATPPEWENFSKAINQQDSSTLMYEMQFYASTFKSAIPSDVTRRLKQSPRWFSLLEPLRSERDYEKAMKVLSLDRDPSKRRIAAMILTNFADRDATWTALMDGITDGDHAVDGMCESALFTLTRYVPRTVDWSPAARNLRNVLNGTNLSALPQVLRTILQTNVSAKLAKPLLRNDGGRMLLPYLRAKHEEERALSHGVLVKLSDKDFGYEDSRWATWMANIK